VGVCLLGGILAAASERPAESQARPIRPTDLRLPTIGRATAADVERLLGAPETREADGALVYTSARSRRHGSPARETVTFRFRDGVLARICRSRLGAGG
jgi:hypothetical protein